MCGFRYFVGFFFPGTCDVWCARTTLVSAHVTWCVASSLCSIPFFSFFFTVPLTRFIAASLYVLLPDS